MIADRYPLMGQFNAFDAGTWNDEQYDVTVVSSSAVSDFTFAPLSVSIIFEVTGPEASSGFCRINVPTELLWVEGQETMAQVALESSGWLVSVGGLSPLNLTVIENDNYTLFWFNYAHSTKIVQITGTNAIPEFPLFIITPLFIIATLMVVAICRRKYRI